MGFKTVWRCSVFSLPRCCCRVGVSLCCVGWRPASCASSIAWIRGVRPPLRMRNWAAAERLTPGGPWSLNCCLCSVDLPVFGVACKRSDSWLGSLWVFGLRPLPLPGRLVLLFLLLQVVWGCLRRFCCFVWERLCRRRHCLRWHSATDCSRPWRI